MIDATSVEAILKHPEWGREGLRKKREDLAAFSEDLRRQMGRPDEDDNNSGDE